MAKFDIRITAPSDHFKWVVVLERQSDLGPVEYQIIWCVDRAEANAALVDALKSCPQGYTCNGATAELEMRGETDNR